MDEVQANSDYERAKCSTLSVPQVYDYFGITVAGLTAEQVLANRAKAGENRLPKLAGRSRGQMFLGQITHFMALLLWGAGGLAFVAELPELGWATWAVIFVNASFSFWQEYRAERALAQLENLLPRRVKVRRSGGLLDVAAAEVVVGDLLELEAGDHVPADARLIEGEEVQVDMSALTGEAAPVMRNAVATDGIGAVEELGNLIFAGTLLTSGRAKAVVLAVGGQTKFGGVARLTAGIKREKSTMEIEIAHMVRMITVLALALGGVVFLLAYGLVGLTVRESLLFCIGIVVANVPEGLLPTVSLSLAVGVQRMARKKALIRRLSAVETLSAASVICTDKTGTLTENALTVREIWLPGGNLISVEGEGYERNGRIRGGETEEKGALAQLLTAAVICNDAELVPDPEDERRWKIVGDPSEAALLVAGAKGGVDAARIRSEFFRRQVEPFSAERRRMSVQVENISNMHFERFQRYWFVKGAPVELLHRCTGIGDGKGAKLMDETQLQEVLRQNDRMAAQGYRVFAVAGSKAGEDSGLCLYGLVGMMDPPRAEVKEAVQACHEAGIRVTMITGDYGLTAAAVGRQVGLTVDAAQIITGIEMGQMEDCELDALLCQDEPLIFARATPADKLRIVEAYKRNGHIVAVTGDGVNDAPALRSAHIGIAMGRGGTDVAREVADIVLLDDHFATIVEAIREGRTVYDNIRKFMTYILASNIPEFVPFVMMIFLKIPPPLFILQILAIDLGTDMLPAMALGAEAAEAGILRRPPRDPRQSLLNRTLFIRAYGFLGSMQALFSMGMFFLVWWMAGYGLADIQSFTPAVLEGNAVPSIERLYHESTTMVMAAIIACQVGNVFICRRETMPWFNLRLMDNRLLAWGIAAEIVAVAVLSYVPVMQHVFATEPLSGFQWGLLLLGPIWMMGIESLRRWLVQRSVN